MNKLVSWSCLTSGGMLGASPSQSAYASHLAAPGSFCSKFLTRGWARPNCLAPEQPRARALSLLLPAYRPAQALEAVSASTGWPPLGVTLQHQAELPGSA